MDFPRAVAEDLTKSFADIGRKGSTDATKDTTNDATNTSTSQPQEQNPRSSFSSLTRSVHHLFGSH
jgi:hypothetical protein